MLQYVSEPYSYATCAIQSINIQSGISFFNKRLVICNVHALLTSLSSLYKPNHSPESLQVREMELYFCNYKILNSGVQI